MIWAAIFLICTKTDCIAVGSPLFNTKEACEYATNNYGLGLIANRYPSYAVMNWKCVNLYEVDT